MKLVDISTATGLPERLVRFLIAEGVVPPPHGSGRGASYDEGHVQAVRRYQALKEAGLNLKAIRGLIEREAGESVSIPVMAGVELRLHPSLVSGGVDAGPILERIAAVLGQALSNDRSNESQPEGNSR